MTYKFSTLQAILRALADDKWHQPSYIAQYANITRPTANKYLKKLLQDKKVVTKGSGAHITYRIADIAYIPGNISTHTYQEHDFDYQQTILLDESFLKYDADGNTLEGVQGFIARCQKRNTDPYTAYHRYESIYNALQELYDSCGLLNASEEFSKHIDEQALDAIYYGNQYKRNEFGRGKIAEMAFFGKQLQNKKLIDEALEYIVPKIECLIKREKVDALAFTPPSIIDRKYQIMDILDKHLSHVNIPRIRLIKDYPGPIRIPQKSLKKRTDRVRNARNSIYVYDETASKYSHVLLIDDFVGSGSTLNETAKKLKQQGVKKVIGFAIVGNMDLSYEVINEV